MLRSLLSITILIAIPSEAQVQWPVTSLTSPTSGASSVHTADLDGDGDMDVLSSSYFDNKIAWYENLGGSFGPQQNISTIAYGASSVYAADLDGDGDMDVLSASALDHRIVWYENYGGSFGGQDISAAANGAWSVYSADLDGDEDMDVLSASYFDDEIAWYENLGSSFGSQQIISIAADVARSVHAADLDGDGDMDVLSASEVGNEIAWYENLGGSFGSPQLIISLGNLSPGLGVQSVHAADLDGDGDLDVLSAIDANIVWHENVLFEGCTDPTACNYNPMMLVDNGSCCYECGCMVMGAENYSSTACQDDGSCSFLVIGTVFFDENENGFMDDGELGLSLQEVEFLPDNLSMITNEEGQFFVNASGADEYTFILAGNPLFPYFTTPQILTFDATQDNWNQNIFFGLSNNEFPSFDLEADLYATNNGFPCDNERDYNLCFRNTSNAFVDVQVEFYYDSVFQAISLSPLIDSLGEYAAYLSYTDVAPNELICAEIELLSPTVDFIGEFLETSFEVTAFVQGEEVAFGADSLNQELTCAYDPNDKQVFPSGYSEAHYVHPDSTLEFLVRFQNTGNAPATDIIIRDTIDDNLDLSTFELVANSHSVFTTVKPDDREVEFYFQDIMLPDSVNNEPESHGFVAYRIDPLENTPLLTELNNTAHILFDNNPPIVTNTTWSTLYDCSLFEVSFTDNGALLTASEGDSYQWYLDGEVIEGATEQEYIVTQNGDYSVQVGIDFPCSDTSSSTFIIVSSIDELANSRIVLFPNPMTTSAFLDLGELKGPATLEIYDLSGKLMRSEILTLDSGILTLERGELASGSYLLRLIAEGDAIEVPFMVD